MMKSILALTAPALVVAGCASAAGPVPPAGFAGSAQLRPAARQPARPGTMPPAPAPVAQILLEAHNRYRREAGVPPLAWDTELAAGAADWARTLSASGELVHSPRAARPGISENLWVGTAGAYSPARGIDSWGEERLLFRDGIFPQVSSTGNWLDVSHYTQMIWRNTTQVGCALHRGPRWEALVCRYRPPGNRDGQRAR